MILSSDIHQVYNGDSDLLEPPIKDTASPDMLNRRPDTFSELRRSRWRPRMCYLLHSARLRAARRSLPFELSVEWALQRLVAQHYQCARTGLPLHLVCPRTGTTYNAFSPSIDRIDSDKGYTPDNSQLVCYMYNTAKNRFRSEDVLIFAEALLSHNSIVNDNMAEA